MKVAPTVWEDTVSTVCDFSSRLLVFDVMGHEVKNKSFLFPAVVKGGNGEGQGDTSLFKDYKHEREDNKG